MIDRGTRIRWRSDGPSGFRQLEGIVRAHIPPGRKARLPKHADKAKFKAKDVNRVHARYLVEVPRRNARSGRPIASLWMAPKAVTLEKRAKEI